MRKYVLVFLGILFLIVDISVTTNIAYPKYQIIANNGVETQRMVMETVVGSHLAFDCIPDVIGFILLLVAIAYLYRDMKRKCMGILCCVAAIAADLLIPLLPLMTEGVSVYGGEYLLHWLKPFLEAVVVVVAVSGCIDCLECKRNHTDNIVIWVFLMAAVACGFIKGIGIFYGMTKTSWVYFALQCVFTLIYIWKMAGNVRNRPKEQA